MNIRETFAPFGEHILENPGGYPFYEKRRFEQHFLDRYYADQSLFAGLSRTFIPVFWTHIYNDRKYLSAPLQDALNSLPRDRPYFTVSTHDDSPGWHKFDGLDVLHFSGGGNYRADNVVPIPLITDPIPEHMLLGAAAAAAERANLVSFMGRNTHPLREDAMRDCNGRPGVDTHMLEWTETRGSELFHSMEKSVFTLCPRGYGPTSFRLYEAMQCGSIPVYLSDIHWLPFLPREEWETFCVLSDTASGMYDRLVAIPGHEVIAMQRKMRETLETYFTIPSCIREILSTIA